MSVLIKFTALALLASAIASTASVADAGVLAGRGWRGGVVAARGPHGSGAAAAGRYGGYYAAGRRTDGAGGYQAGRTLQGPRGAGFDTGRTGACGSGACSGSSTTTFNDGKAIERSYSATRNADGSVTYDRSRTGVNGQTRSASGTYTPPN
jgi:hypothetical protein